MHPPAQTLVILNLILVAAGTAAVADAASTAPAATRPQRRQALTHVGGGLPVPAEFTVSLTADRTQYVLGENVLVHFRVENTGDKPFAVHHGGDYRGAPRQTRFIVRATPVGAAAAAAGAGGARNAPDPYPIINHFGG